MSTTATPLRIGDAAPTLRLPATPEGTIDAADYRGRYVVLYFYPKDNTPGCTLESNDFNALIDDFAALNAQILGVSRDSQRSHCNFANKFSFRFPLLADSDEQLCLAFDVMRDKTMYGKKVRGIERSTFLIDPEGKIAALWRKVKVEGHAAEVLARLRGLHR